MKAIMRSARVLLPLTNLLVASAAYCAETPSPNVEPAAATTPPTQTATQAQPTAAPGAAVVSPEASGSAASLAEPPQNPPSYPASSASLTTPTPAPRAMDDGPPTLLGRSGRYAFGGFGGIGVMYTRFAGRDTAQVCGEGGFIFDHALTLGGGGCGIATTVNAEQYGPAPHYANDRMSFGYGGAIIRYHLFSNKPVNLAVGALIGAGGLTIGTWDGSGRMNDWSDNYSHRRRDVVFVVEPQIGGYANLTRWMRVGVTAGYRIVSGVDTQGLSAKDLSAPTLGGVIQGGWF